MPRALESTADRVAGRMHEPGALAAIVAIPQQGQSSSQSGGQVPWASASALESLSASAWVSSPHTHSAPASLVAAPNPDELSTSVSKTNSMLARHLTVPRRYRVSLPASRRPATSHTTKQRTLFVFFVLIDRPFMGARRCRCLRRRASPRHRAATPLLAGGPPSATTIKTQSVPPTSLRRKRRRASPT